MTQIVHRHTFTIADAVSALLPDIGDCDSWQVRVEGDQVVVDVVEPASDPVEKISRPEPQPARKGGDLARKAGIICSEKGFWTFLEIKYDAEVRSAEDAASWIRQHCGIRSRADLDHEPLAGEAFRQIDKRYGLWLDGFD